MTAKIPNFCNFLENYTKNNRILQLCRIFQLCRILWEICILRIIQQVCNTAGTCKSLLYSPLGISMHPYKYSTNNSELTLTIHLALNRTELICRLHKHSNFNEQYPLVRVGSTIWR